MPSGAKAKELVIKVDIEKMTIPDLAILSNVGKSMGEGLPDLDPLVELLNRVVVGGVDAIPATAFRDVMNALNTAMNQVIGADAEASEGN